MTKINDGGFAFPHSRVWHGVAGYDETKAENGMTLRDWFAGQALANPRTFPTDWMCTQDIADQAYAIADAMLAAREAVE